MRQFSSLSLCIFALSAVACQSVGVGDPCDPENVPEGGFVGSESYLELSSVQCRTRVCMVYQLAGDTRVDPTDPSCADPDVNCVASAQEIARRVFCTCRCGGPSGQSKCDCPGGFACTEVFTQGGDGVRGNYCVPESLILEDTPDASTSEEVEATSTEDTAAEGG